MSKKENLLIEIDRIDRQIAGLQGYLHEAGLYPEQVQLWPRLKRSIYLFLLWQQVTRQIQQLHLQRRGFLNCYEYVFKERPQSLPLREQRSSLQSPVIDGPQ